MSQEQEGQNKNRVKKVRIKLDLWKDGTKIYAQTFFRDNIERDRKAAYHILESTPFDRCYIKVTYPLGSDYYNDGYYTDVETAKRVLSAFTEINLVKDFS